MKKRILAVLILSTPLLGLGSATAFAGQAAPAIPATPVHVAHQDAWNEGYGGGSYRAISHQEGMILKANNTLAAIPTSTGWAYARNNGAQPVWMNDSQSTCNSSTPVIGWGSNARTQNMQVYFINQGNGYLTLHFNSCGNEFCVWQYGFNGTNNLYMHVCNGNNYADLLWYGQTSSGYWQIHNGGDSGYYTGSNIVGNSLTDNNYYTYGNSEWGFYS
jgi:hypothetical protein